mgnify:CR=1 FL=1
MRALLLATTVLMAPAALATPATAPATDHHHAEMTQSAPTPAPNDQPEATAPTQLVPDAVVMTPMELSDRPHELDLHSSHDITPLDPEAFPLAAADRSGGQLLESRINDGVREFTLAADELAWPITEDTNVAAFAYNGQLPGPMIRVKAGEKIRILFTNNLSEPTTVHWHGIDVPIEMDGVPGISQDPVPPGGTFHYEFTVPNTPGTFFYHSHVMPDRQQALGLAGAFIIDPATPPKAKAWDSEHTFVLGEWTVKEGGNVPSMPMEGMLPNYFTINGKSWPASGKISATVGERVLLRIINAGAFSHPIHLHGAPFRIVAADGRPVPTAAQLTKDTLSVAPGERYDLLWTPTRPGTWLLHCHINHHTMNDGQEQGGMGGMAVPIEVSAP